jgi:hypothetical protein
MANQVNTAAANNTFFMMFGFLIDWRSTVLPVILLKMPADND